MIGKNAGGETKRPQPGINEKRKGCNFWAGWRVLFVKVAE
ncbi:hypothetical protein CHK_2094 [Christensenella hongkongensis]|uniref:Uncharacterized protein n=1 Tax=Christensenella hongkongensis TaxID=270498 RepID=A0A0M2NGG1_9FIRM|nr:hypothetical protein CHK_2094 [Christensenella hongkongensis]